MMMDVENIKLQSRVKELEDINHTLTAEVERLINKVKVMKSITEYHVTLLESQVKDLKAFEI